VYWRRPRHGSCVRASLNRWGASSRAVSADEEASPLKPFSPDFGAVWAMTVSAGPVAAVRLAPARLSGDVQLQQLPLEHLAAARQREGFDDMDLGRLLVRREVLSQVLAQG
jgi:hypothetical protein